MLTDTAASLLTLLTSNVSSAGIVPLAAALSMRRIAAVASPVLATLWETRNRSPAANAFGSLIAIAIVRAGRSSPATLMTSPTVALPPMVIDSPFTAIWAGEPKEVVRAPESVSSTTQREFCWS